MNAFSQSLNKLPGASDLIDTDHIQFSSIHFLLDDLQSPINIGKCARVAEVFDVNLYIHDPRKLTNNPDAVRVIADFSCGASERRSQRIFDDLPRFISNYKKGRLVATCLREDAVRLQDFEFTEGDLIMFGNEYEGLKDDLIERADARIHIAMPKAYLPKPNSSNPIDPTRRNDIAQNGTPCLNVAVAAGIVGYAFSCWQEKNRQTIAARQSI